MKKIVFAGGCFWGVQKYMDSIEGVLYTNVGYANGNTINPTYEEVCNDNTGHTEAVYVEYEETKIFLVELLEKYWRIIDPTTKNRQKMDIGTQYRTGIFYYDETDCDIILKSRDKEQEKYERKIVTEIRILENFYEAEGYHQKYLEKNPNGYCHLDFSSL